MIRLYFSTAAREELDEAFDYLEQQQLGLGYRFTADVDDALARIRGEQAEILAIAHDSRRPGYWRNRKN